MTVAAIILAAGTSRRLGQPKQELRFGGETLLERAVRIANAAGLDPVFAVIAPDRLPLPGPSATALINPDAAEGMASSIRTGVLAADRAGVDGAVILACDQPAVTAGHLRALIRDGGLVVASAYAGRKGVPAYFPSSVFGELLELRGDTGARGLLSSARAIPLANGELDIDTEEDLARAQALFPEGLPD